MKVTVAIFTAVIVCSISKTYGQVLVPGPCADHAVVQNFSIPSYLGAWYEIENTFASNQGNGICVVANYSDFGNGSVRVYNTQINLESGEVESALGSARPADPSKNEAKLLVNFPFTGTSESPYWVLDTDYTSYSIVWSCRPSQDGLNSLQTVWHLSRTRNASEFRQGYVHGYLTALDFDVNNLEETVQTNCPEVGNLIN